MIINNYSGLIHYVDSKVIICSLRGKLYKSNDGGKSWQNTINLSSGYKEIIVLRTRLFRRLSRFYIYHVVPVGDKWAVFGLKSFFLLGQDQTRVICKLPIVGSKPLKVCVNSHGVYYGEYHSNKKRNPVRLWIYSLKENNWQLAWQFDNIRHIHGVFVDPYEDHIWVTTGDKNEESAIWRTKDNFNTIEKVAGGNQQYRAIHLIFTEAAVYFGSDTPCEKNHLYRLKRKDHEIIHLTEVGGSVFHGCKVDNWLFFSTAVEPSLVNTSQNSEIWASPDGKEWRCIFQFKKDIWNKTFFQFGQILFSEGPGDDNNLWITPLATNRDQSILRISLKEVEKLFHEN